MSELRYMDRETRQRLFCRCARSARFDVQKLAGLCHVSVRQLERYVSADCGRAINEWLAEQRMIAAVQLLVESESVKQASDALGYSRTTNFSREFRRVHGLSPRQFLSRWHQAHRAMPSDFKCPFLASQLPCPFRGATPATLPV